MGAEVMTYVPQVHVNGRYIISGEQEQSAKCKVDNNSKNNHKDNDDGNNNNNNNNDNNNK